jgi:hypothetical protein
VPLDAGLEVPVAHVSGQVTDNGGTPVENVIVTTEYSQSMFAFALNQAISDVTGHYDMVVLPNQTWTLNASLPDDHPRINELWVPDEVNVAVAEEDVVVDITMPDEPLRCPLSGQFTTSDGVALEFLELNHYASWYGLYGWRFRSDTPGVYYRYGYETPLLDSIPLVCGVQSLQLFSRRSSQAFTCDDPERFNQFCFDGYQQWQSFDLSEPQGGFVFEVVTLSGTVTMDGDTPIEDALIEVSATVVADGPVTRGNISNYASSGADGTYQLVVMPGGLFSYDITITTPPSVGLGQVTFIETITADTTIDANFSSVE